MLLTLFFKLGIFPCIIMFYPWFQVQWQSREVYYYLKGSSPQGFFSVDPARNIYAILEFDRGSQVEVTINIRNNQSEVVAWLLQLVLRRFEYTEYLLIWIKENSHMWNNRILKDKARETVFCLLITPCLIALVFMSPCCPATQWIALCISGQWENAIISSYRRKDTR